jgi:hypothetical protein
MYKTISSPFPESLSLEVERNSERAPEENQTHVQHDGRQVTIVDDPVREKLRKPVAPEILVDRNCDKNTARDRLVAVHAVS